MANTSYQISKVSNAQVFLVSVLKIAHIKAPHYARKNKQETGLREGVGWRHRTAPLHDMLLRRISGAQSEMMQRLSATAVSVTTFPWRKTL